MAPATQPAPLKTFITSLFLVAATALGGLSLGRAGWPLFAAVALLTFITDLSQPRVGRKAFQILPYDAGLYAGMMLLSGGGAGLLGVVAACSGLSRRLPFRHVLSRAAVFAISGYAGGHAVDALQRHVPGWAGHVTAIGGAGLLVFLVTCAWRPAIARSWKAAGCAELQAAVAGWLLASQLHAGEYLGAVLTGGMFVVLRWHMLRRAHTIARNWSLTQQEHAWTTGMAAAREAVRDLEAAATPQALTDALAKGAVTLPGVAAVAVWEAGGNAPPRLAAFARPQLQRAGDGQAGEQAPAMPPAVLSALPSPGVSKALQGGTVEVIDQVCYVPLRRGPYVQSVAEVSLQPGSDPAVVLHLFGTVVDYFRARMKNLDLLARAQDDFLATVRVLAATVDARDHYTRQHSENVSALARRIALEMGLSQEETADIAMAGLLHDIGKIGIPDAILTKKGPLDVAERQLMMSHAEVGAGIVMQAEPLMHLAPLVRHHHEWYDGNGYPDGLKGEQIPLGAAIIAVADAYDTMTSDRPYRPGVKPEVAATEIQRCAGTQFHPDVAAAVLRLLERGAMPRAVATADVLPSEAHRTLAGRHHQAQFISVRMMQRLGAELSLLLNLDELLERSLAIIRDEMGFTTGGLLLKDPDGNIRLSAATGFLSPLVGLVLPPGRGLSRWVIENGEPLRVDDVNADSRYFGGPGSGPVGSELAVPLKVNDETLGCVIVSSERSFGFTEQDEALLTAAAGPLAQAIKVALLHRSALPSTDTDSLTAVLNRRGAVQALSTALAGASRHDPVWLAAFDLQGLGRFNRRHGFRAGDALLQAFGQHLTAALGPEATVGRLSADQFVAILPVRNRADAEALLRQAATGWEGAKVETAGTVCAAPPCHHGLVQCPHDLSNIDDVICWADYFPLLTPEMARARAAPSAGD